MILIITSTSPHNTHRVVFATKVHTVLCTVPTEPLNTIQINFSLQKVKLNAFVLRTETDTVSNGCKIQVETWSNLINIRIDNEWRVLKNN